MRGELGDEVRGELSDGGERSGEMHIKEWCLTVCALRKQGRSSVSCPLCLFKVLLPNAGYSLQQGHAWQPEDQRSAACVAVTRVGRDGSASFGLA